jgi:tetratricopeptide (TPR) repeat protein
LRGIWGRTTMKQLVWCFAFFMAVVTYSDVALAGPKQDYKACVDANAETTLDLCSIVINTAKQSDVNKSVAFNNRCWAHIQAGDYKKAIPDCDAAIQLNAREPNFFDNRCRAHEEIGNFDEAIADCSVAIKLKPDFAIAFNNRCWALGSKGDFAKALVDCTKAIDLDPRLTNALSNRCWVHLNLGNFKKAIQDCDKAIKLEPTHAGAFNNRCWAQNEQGDFDKAISDCSEAIRLKPDFADAHTNLAFSYDEKGDIDKAIVELSKAISIDPSNAVSWNNRGYSRSKKAEFDLAITDFNESIRLDEKLPNPYRHRAAAKMAKGDLRSARLDAEKALALKPDYADAKQTLADIEKAENKAGQPQVIATLPQDKTVPTTQPIQNPPLSEKRVALVIGNSAYSDGMALPNPTNDANAVAQSLTRLGFEVILATDATKAAMTDAMYRFAVLADSAEAAMVFYAGHGMQVDGVNYLMPIDASIESRADLKHKFVSADEILDDLRSVKGMRMMVLDACRNNPLSRSVKLKLAKLSTRAIENRDGLADMKAEGVLIAFATQPNEVAADGDAANSPFTLALLKHLETPNIEIDTMFKRVRTSVSEMTDGVQLPQTVNSSTGEFYLKLN